MPVRACRYRNCFQVSVLPVHRTRSKAAHLVTTIAHPETTEVANHLIGQGDNVLTAELVHPEELMSGLLSQVGITQLVVHGVSILGLCAIYHSQHVLHATHDLQHVWHATQHSQHILCGT